MVRKTYMQVPTYRKKKPESTELKKLFSTSLLPVMHWVVNVQIRKTNHLREKYMVWSGWFDNYVWVFNFFINYYLPT